MRSILVDKPIYFTDAKDSRGACLFQTPRWIWTSFGLIALGLKRNLLRWNCVWEIQKVGMSFDDSQKLLLKEKTLNNYTSPNSVRIFFCQGWNLAWICPICAVVLLGVWKYLNQFLAKIRASESQKKRQKYPFWYFFNPLNYTLSLFITLSNHYQYRRKSRKPCCLCKCINQSL